MTPFTESCEVDMLKGDKFLHYWPYIKGEMEKIPHLWDRWWTMDSIFEGVMSGRFQVWAAGSGKEYKLIVITQVAHYPANTILQGILMLGNSLEECAPVLDATLEKWGRDSRCTMCEVSGRKGWARFLKSYGFKETAVVLHRPIGEHRVQ